MEARGKAPPQKNLMDNVYFLSLTISTAIILAVQLLSVLVISFFMAQDLNRNAAAAADEMSAVLTEPLYNVDDAQSRRILGTLLSSGRVSGVYLESTASGLVYIDKPDKPSPWIEPQVRDIYYRDIHLGRFELYYSDSTLREIIKGILSIMLILIAGVVTTNLAASRVLIQRRIRGIFGPMIEGINRIADGDYERKLALSGYNDMDSIIRVINEMSERIRQKNEELTQINSTLETRVLERTRELNSALEEQRMLQDRLVKVGKLSALGQVTAGIAHELNTPLGAIQSSARTLTLFFEETLPGLAGFTSSLEDPERRLYDAALDLGLRGNRSLAGSFPEKKALRAIEARLQAAGTGKEKELAELISDTGMADSLDSLLPLLPAGRDEEILRTAGESAIARRMLEVIHESSRKAATVISALRSYLYPRQEGDNTLVDLAEDIPRVLTLMHNMLKRGIVVNTHLDRALVRGSSDKLSQVWMNIIRNAVQAMDYSGRIEIRAERKDGSVVVSFADSGPGIPDGIRRQIFEPFFTTKKEGEGMGLGLEISKKIVEAYGGSIRFTTRPGRTVFIVTLPAAEGREES